MTTDTSTNSLNIEMKKLNVINLNSPQISNEQIKNKNTENNNGIHSDGRWNNEEHIRFIKGCLKFGNNWKKVEGYVKSRTSTQIRSHAQKFLIKLKRKYNINDQNFNDDKDTSNYIIKQEDIKDENNKNDIENIINNLNNTHDIEMEMEKVEKLLLKIFKINKRNGELQIVKRIKTPPNSKNKKIFKCQKEMKSTQLKDKIYTWLNSNEKEDLINLLNLIHSPDEKTKSIFQSVYQNDEIYRQIYNE